MVLGGFGRLREEGWAQDVIWEAFGRHLGAHWQPSGRHVSPGGDLLGSPAAFVKGLSAFGKGTHRFHRFLVVPGTKKVSIWEGKM